MAFGLRPMDLRARGFIAGHSFGKLCGSEAPEGYEFRISLEGFEATVAYSTFGGNPIAKEQITRCTGRVWPPFSTAHILLVGHSWSGGRQSGSPHTRWTFPLEQGSEAKDPVTGAICTGCCNAQEVYASYSPPRSWRSGHAGGHRSVGPWCVLKAGSGQGVRVPSGSGVAAPRSRSPVRHSSIKAWAPFASQRLRDPVKE